MQRDQQPDDRTVARRVCLPETARQSDGAIQGVGTDGRHPGPARRGFLQALFLGAATFLEGARVSAATRKPDQKPETPPLQAAAPRPIDALASHPLDPLTAPEIDQAVRVLRDRGLTDRNSRFWTVELEEPPKEQVLRADGNAAPPRRALAVVYHKDTGITIEHVVDLAAEHVVESRTMKGSQAGPLSEEYSAVPGLVRVDPKFVQAMARRGITDLNTVYLEVWAAGPIPIGDPPGGRKFRVVPYLEKAAETLYARPIEGVLVTVDMRQSGGAGAVISVLDQGIVPLSPERSDPPRNDGPRTPAVAQQPEPQSAGTRGFSVQGHLVSWGPWQFRCAFLDREGLVLYDVKIRDGERLRSVLYRASLSEMIAAYGDPDRTWAWRNAFDEGEYGVGKCSVPLRTGAEVPHNAVLLDATFADDLGRPSRRADRVGLYERDAGVLWTHAGSRLESTRRGTELVVQFISTVGNYDYVISWIFAEDGRLTYQVDPSGILLVKGVPDVGCAVCAQPPNARGEIAPAGQSAFGTLVAPHLLAVNHQHLFSMRLDFDIDGAKNAVRELETVSLPHGPRNPFGNAFEVRERALLTERAARRDAAPYGTRLWKIINVEKPGELGHFPGYMIGSMSPAKPLARPENRGRSRAGFPEHTFWVTRYRDSERYASGFYIDSDRSPGLKDWSRDESLEGEDIVVWYTFGGTHVPRSEEWPIMPSAHFGFVLTPHNFFSSNPTYPPG